MSTRKDSCGSGGDKEKIIKKIEEIQADFTKNGGSLEDELEQVYNAIKDHVEYIHYTKQ